MRLIKASWSRRRSLKLPPTARPAVSNGSRVSLTGLSFNSCIGHGPSMMSQRQNTWRSCGIDEGAHERQRRLVEVVIGCVRYAAIVRQAACIDGTIRDDPPLEGQGVQRFNIIGSLTRRDQFQAWNYRIGYSTRWRSDGRRAAGEQDGGARCRPGFDSPDPPRHQSGNRSESERLSPRFSPTASPSALRATAAAPAWWSRPR